MPEIALIGCTPEPLISYLKALGVFRLVAEQADADASLSWGGGVAYLHSTLDHESLTRFFLDRYSPTPIATPWNSASGFAPTKPGNKAPKDLAARAAIQSIVRSECVRLANYRETIAAIVKLPRYSNDPKTWKQEFFSRCRAQFDDRVVEWLDTCFALTNSRLADFPLLGSGGNDGVTDFGSLFLQRIDELVARPGVKHEKSAGWLQLALFGDGGEPLISETVGQFNPGGIGGANGTQGSFEADSRLNPWDYVLMIEGAVLFAGSVVRRLATVHSGEHAAFPFCVESVVVGNGSFSDKDARDRGKEPPNGGELWAPLWSKPVSYRELRYFFSEGRAQLGRRQARNSLEFSLAANLLGVSRGIDSFCRFGFLRRNGKAFMAAPLGRVSVTVRPAGRVLDDSRLTDWIDRLRNACKESDGKRDAVPQRYKAALRHIDKSIFAFCTRSEIGNDSDALCSVIRALGAAERTLAREGLSWLNDKNYGWKLRPLQGLSPEFLSQADDNSSEFRLAASLAGISGTPKGEIGPLRVFLEETELKHGYFSWLLGSSSAVWSARPLAENLAAVFLRRQLEAFRMGIQGVPLRSPRKARLTDVVSFLQGEMDEVKLVDLIWGLIGIEWSRVEPATEFSSPKSIYIPVEFGLARLLVAPGVVEAVGKAWAYSASSKHEGSNILPDTSVFSALRAAGSTAITNSMERATRRLNLQGAVTVGCRNSQGMRTPANPVTTSPARLLASMLFPLSDVELTIMVNTILYPPEVEE